MTSNDRNGKAGASRCERFFEFWKSTAGIVTGIAGILGAVAAIVALFVSPGPSPGGGGGDESEYKRQLQAICDEAVEDGKQIQDELSNVRVTAGAKDRAIGDSNPANDTPAVEAWLDSEVRYLNESIDRTAAIRGELAGLQAPERYSANHAEMETLLTRQLDSLTTWRDQLLTIPTDARGAQLAQNVNISHGENLTRDFITRLSRVAGPDCV